MKARISRLRAKKRTTISLSAELLAKGEQRARAARRNFSNYVEVLIEADCGGRRIPPGTQEVQVPA